LLGENKMSSMWSISVRTRTVFILLFLIGLLVYVNSLEVPFHFDDIYYLKENLQIKSFSTFQRWLTESYSGFFTNRPVLLFTFLLNYSIGGLDTFGYHFFNVLVHILNAFFFYVLFARYADPDSRTGYSIPYVLAAIIFLIHPVNTESVTYISSRSSVLSTFFVLASMLSFFRATEMRLRLPLYLLSILFFLTGLFTKEAAIVLPALLMLFDYFFVSNSGRGLKARLKYHVPFFLLTLALSLVYLSYLTRPEADRPWATHIPTELNVFVEYGKLLFVPLGLTIDHDVTLLGLFSGRALFSLTALMTLIALALFLKKKNPAIAFSIFWFFISLAPFLVIRVKDFMAERWLYTASLGFAVGVSGVVMFASQSYRKTVRAVVALLLVLLGVLTITRNQVYSSPILLWQDAVKKAPEKSRPYINLSGAYMENGQVALGVANIQEGIKLGKKNGGLKGTQLVAAYMNLAAAYQNGNDLQKAEGALKTIEREAAGFREYHHSLGLIYMKTRRYDQALVEFKKALAIRPSSPTYLYLLGDCCEMLGQHKTAQEYFSRATAGVPQSGSDFIHQGLAFYKLGEKDRLLSLLFEGVKADPLDLSTRLYLADTLLSRQFFDDAWKQYAIAAAFSPRSVSAYRGMGIILLSRGERREASMYFEKALGFLPPESPERKGLLELLDKAKG